MKIAIIGGGPGGLYFSISMKLRNPDIDVTVYERNKSNDTFGWGVVLSDQTLSNLRLNDPVSADSIESHFAYWDKLAVVVNKEREESTGHGFCGIGRMQLLLLLQQRAQELGVRINFETVASSVEELKEQFDIVVASDGLNSKTRETYQNTFQPMIDTRACKFVWLGTKQKFQDAFTFIFEKTDKGWIWAHAYQFDNDTATFIVETDEQTWLNYDFGNMSQQESIVVCEEIFKEHLGGNPLLTNANHIRGSAWINFPRILCKKWHHENVTLVGDAAATAHFSIGSGTKLALESAISLAELIHTEPNTHSAFEKYETDRRAQVMRLQSAALNSLEWFENIHRYINQPLVQFNYSQLTRSQRIGHENLRLRDPDFLKRAERWFQGDEEPLRSPMFCRYKLRELTLNNRIVVAPMSQYRADDGHIGDWHFVHYGERAKGGAGLIVSEALAVLPTGRATEGDAGLYLDSHMEQWTKLLAFTHAEGQTHFCAQLGHAGPRGSTKLPSDGENEPLDIGWELIAASSIPWSPQARTPKEASENDMVRVTDAFIAAANRALQAGFDMLEINAAAGTLLATFLSPATNMRQDNFGGSVENRQRFPLTVVKAVRDVWPASKPLAIRFCAHDWLARGLSSGDSTIYAKAFKDAGVDLQVITTGETLSTSKPEYGRMYQTPFSDRIRNEAHVNTMTVGNIYEADHANSILLAGRADLVAVGRPHLYDPYWTHRQAARLGDSGQTWPSSYLYGAQQLAVLESSSSATHRNASQ